MTASQFADLLEVQPQRVSELIRQGLPTTRNGRAHAIDTRAAIDWLIARKVEMHRAPDGSESMAQAQLRKAIANAGLAEHRETQASNEVISRDAVDALVSAMMVIVWAQLVPLADELGPALAVEPSPAECRRLIHDATRECRARMAAQFEAQAVAGALPL